MKIKVNGEELRITSQYLEIDSWHPVPHSGVDIAIVEGTELYTPIDGIARIVDYGNVNIGKGVIIETKAGERLIFGHLSDNSVLIDGQWVRAGELIGLSGNTGRSSGPHLHLGLKDSTGQFIDPSKYVGEGLFVPSPEQHISLISSNPNPDSNGDMFQMAMEQFTNMLSEMKMQTVNFIITQLPDFILHVYSITLHS